MTRLKYQYTNDGCEVYLLSRELGTIIRRAGLFGKSKHYLPDCGGVGYTSKMLRDIADEMDFYNPKSQEDNNSFFDEVSQTLFIKK